MEQTEGTNMDSSQMSLEQCETLMALLRDAKVYSYFNFSSPDVKGNSSVLEVKLLTNEKNPVIKGSISVRGGDYLESLRLVIPQLLAIRDKRQKTTDMTITMANEE